jgi:arsenate reductase-like glutaredoxin family protein
MEIQIFGTRKNADTRKALRFFSERRIKTHFVDLDVRPASPGELKRFALKFGVQALLDRDSKRFAALGLAHAHHTDERWLQTLAEEPLLLRQPLVRNGNQLTVGLADAAWKSWTTGERAAGTGWSTEGRPILVTLPISSRCPYILGRIRARQVQWRVTVNGRRSSERRP